MCMSLLTVFNSIEALKWLTLKRLESPGGRIRVSIITAGNLVQRHQAINIHNIARVPVIPGGGGY